MKVVCHELGLAMEDPEGTGMDEIVKDADKLVSCLANKARNSLMRLYLTTFPILSLVSCCFWFDICGRFRRHELGGTHFCFGIICVSKPFSFDIFMQTFQNKNLAHAAKESTVTILITELLLWLLDERVPRMDDGSQLLKALNVLMLKILDNADRTTSFVVLINLLRPLDPSRWPSPTANESLAVRNQKFSDLVVKCLIKLTKVILFTIYEVDLDRILQSIHIYLQELGMEEIRKRAGADGKPLRMVKTVLHELVKLRGTAIKGHLSMVPIDMQPPPIILAYIDLNLQTLAAARMLTPSVPGQTHWGDSTANNPAPTTHSDAQLKQELAAIFKKIGDKQTCKIGLSELYRITQLYPKVDIFAQLQNASEAFRTYIRDGLAQMEKNAAAGRTPSSVPMPTPPPSALDLSSPKFGPLSPVNTNPSNDTKSVNSKVEPTHFSLPPSYAEDERSSNTVLSRGSVMDTSELRQQLGEQRIERLPSGVTGGTLEAIRERMKSIQLAASTGIPDPGNRPVMSTNGGINHGISIPTQHSSATEHIVSENPPPPQSGILPMDEKALSGLQARMERLKSGSLEPL
nr:protein MOR1 isoform X1 [Ipomoea batatas]